MGLLRPVYKREWYYLGKQPAVTRVLVVCAANVCRSPYAQYLIERAFLGTGLSVASAGTSALVDASMCKSTQSSLLKLDPGAGDFISTHRSTQLTADAIGEADIVLSSSRTERHAVAALDPTARSKSFTLLEAAALAEAVAATVSPLEGLSTAQWAMAMHLQLGRVQIPQSTRFGRRLIDPVSIFDVGDVHTGEANSHRPVHASIRAAVGRLAMAARVGTSVG